VVFLDELAVRWIAEVAQSTTRYLIVVWSTVAIIALVGLGRWVARRVSDPLAELAAGARRIADGDFSTKVHVQGSDEVAELADSFNTMTDSLKERSEALTKKVLELATLYEMSRALGSTLDMDELLGSMLESALRIFDLDLGYVVLRDKDNGALSIRALHRGDGPGVDSPTHSSMSEWVVREGRPLVFNPDSASDSGQIDAVTGAKAALCVPLVSTEGTIGSITIGSSDSACRFNTDDVRLLSTIANHVTIAVGNIELFTSLQEAYLATVRSLAAAVDAKDSYTRGHSDHVAAYSTLIATRMGLSHEQKTALEMAAYLHDIGKIGIAEDILLKPGRLSGDEMEQMRHHPLIGANILKPVAFPWAIAPVVRHHHESWDGNGYPAGLAGEEIPLLARILTVADSYEAMTADRPYRQGMSANDALAELRSCAGAQFDPAVVEAFAETFGELEVVDHLVETAAVQDVAPGETREVFSALVEGVFGSFHRLGGPRLAANVESEIDAAFRLRNLPFILSSGAVEFTQDPPEQPEEELHLMRDALRRIDSAIGRCSGGTLVEHFYDDALGGLPIRTRQLASDFGFYRS
jgi:putative nucleotidyltransferase with HDIG domain